MGALREDTKWFRIVSEGPKLVLYPKGKWRLANLNRISPELDAHWSISSSDDIILDGSELEKIDTSGAMLIYHSLRDTGVSWTNVRERNVRPEHHNIGVLVKNYLDTPGEIRHPVRYTTIERLGSAAIEVTKKTRDVLSFIGLTAWEALRTGLDPRRVRFKELFVQLERVCVDAIPIVCLVTLLIGVVIAYLFAIQSEQYGANIFIVDAVGLAMCRELSPVIVAIIVAGRSGSAFTAQIGAMKLNDELDAMKTLGLSVMQVLVVPRMLALVIALPLLVFIGDVVGIFGAMCVADVRLGITTTTFVERLGDVLPIKSFLVGLIKAPVFAAFIAVIGCRMGLEVEKNATSLGLSTTSTVVQSIVSVILLNAAFAVIFVELGI